MKRILVTGFEPFGELATNCTELALRELTLSELAPDYEVEQRILPVEYVAAQGQLADLYREKSYAATLHFGQSSKARNAEFEMFAINWKHVGAAEPGPLDHEGPQAFRTQLDHATWQESLQAADICGDISFHAGTYLCNAVYYWSLQQSEQIGNPGYALFVHVPLAAEQGGNSGDWPVAKIQKMMATTLLWLANQIALA